MSDNADWVLLADVVEDIPFSPGFAFAELREQTDDCVIWKNGKNDKEQLCEDLHGLSQLPDFTSIRIHPHEAYLLRHRLTRSS